MGSEALLLLGEEILEVDSARGQATGYLIDETGADDHINKLSQKYVGKPVYAGRQPGEVRVLYKIESQKVSSMG